MNKNRRIRLQKVMDSLSDIKDNLEMIQEEEDEYKDSIPENLQGSERYEKVNAACEYLYEVVSQIEEAISSIETSME